MTTSTHILIIPLKKKKTKKVSIAIFPFCSALIRSGIIACFVTQIYFRQLISCVHEQYYSFTWISSADSWVLSRLRVRYLSSTSTIAQLFRSRRIVTKSKRLEWLRLFSYCSLRSESVVSGVASHFREEKDRKRQKGNRKCSLNWSRVDHHDSLVLR